VFYRAGSQAPVSLGAPAMIIDDRAHVPLSFFTEAAGFSNAYFFEGQIDINNLEPMR
jgi:hypothetical protein